MTITEDQLDAQVRAVEIARTILRSEAPHTVGNIREACKAMMTYGGVMDYIEAQHMMDVLDKREFQRMAMNTYRRPDPEPIQRPPYSQGHGRIRAVLIGATLGVWGIWGLLVVVMAW